MSNWLKKYTLQQLALKADAASVVETDGDQTLAGVKTFSSFPVTPSAAPTTNYQVANKKYVDDNAGGHTQNTDTGLGALSTKNPPIDADKAIYRDSTASDGLVTSTWAQIKAFLKTYFDGLYSASAHTHSYLPLAGGVITGRLGFSSVMTPVEEMVEHAGETTIILDASTAAVSANIGDGASYVNMILFVVCVDVTNGASLIGTIQGSADYTFTAAGECLILKQVDALVPSAWWIVGKYTP